MFYFGDLCDIVKSRIDDASTETLVVIKREANLAWFELCAKHPWTFLRTSASLPFTADQTTGTLLPGDLYDIYGLYDANGYEWVRRDQKSRREDIVTQKWYYSAAIDTPLAEGADAVVSANGTTVTSAAVAFGTGRTGEYVKIGANRGVYKIATNANTGTITLTQGYKGDAETAASFEIRPRGLKRILLDEADAETLTCYYWTQPLPLYNTYDVIPFPEPQEALIMAVWTRMLRWQKYDTDADRLLQEYDDKVQTMMQADPTPTFHIPRNYRRGQLYFGRRRT